MDHVAAEEKFIDEKLIQDLNEFFADAQSHFPETYYSECKYECKKRMKNESEIGNCVEDCCAAVIDAQNLFQSEIAMFQEKLSTSLTVCQDKYELAKLQPNSNNPPFKDFLSCVELSVIDSINAMPQLGGEVMPRVAGKLKACLSFND